MAKKRLDVLLFEKGLCPSRERAKTAIMEGIVYIAGQKAGKAGDMVDENAELEVRGNDNAFVSRGGKKIEKALNYFAIDPSGLTVMDVGASTGGFTDCLLRRGAEKVYSIDVGYGQLAWSLRQDPRVKCMERTNIRYVTPDMLEETPSLCVIDVSFISLKLVLPVVAGLLTEDGRVANLINKNFGEIPALDEDSMTNEDRALLKETSDAFDEIGALIEKHHQKNALVAAMRVVGDINKYISAEEPWKIKDDEARLGTVLHVAAQAGYDANHLLAPFLPHASQKVYEALGGSGVFSPLPRLEEVEDLDKPGFTYPIITGDYKLGETVHPWESERLVAGTPVPKPHPIFAKIPPEAVAEELTRFDTELAARKKAEAERFAAAQAELKQ